MAGSMRCLLKFNLGLLSRNVTRHIVFNQTRTLFAPQSLGMVAYENLRQHYKQQFHNLEDSFKEKMAKFVEGNESNASMIFTDDLKVMLHMAENTPEDIELVVKMLKKFNVQNSKMRFGTYNFGPVCMRWCYRLNDPQLALKLFKDTEFGDFFKQLSTYQVLLDLLYQNEMYKDMREVYDIIQKSGIGGMVHPRQSLLLVTAGCYKENTEESMNYSMKLWHDLNERGYPYVRRVLTHIAALWINRGVPHLALEALSTATKPRYVGIRCLKVMAYADLDRLNDIVPYFRSSLDSDSPSNTGRGETWFKDAISKVEDAIERANLGEDADIVQLLKLIKTRKLIENKTMDDHINTPINVVKKNPQNYQRNPGSSDFDRRGDHSGPRFLRRPSLMDVA